MHCVVLVDGVCGRCKHSKAKVFRVHCRAKLTAVLDGPGDVLANLACCLCKDVESALAGSHIVDVFFDVFVLSNEADSHSGGGLLLLFLLCSAILVMARQ